MQRGAHLMLRREINRIIVSFRKALVVPLLDVCADALYSTPVLAYVYQLHPMSV